MFSLPFQFSHVPIRRDYFQFFSHESRTPPPIRGGDNGGTELPLDTASTVTPLQKLSSFSFRLFRHSLSLFEIPGMVLLRCVSQTGFLGLATNHRLTDCCGASRLCFGVAGRTERTKRPKRKEESLRTGRFRNGATRVDIATLRSNGFDMTAILSSWTRSRA